MGFPRQEYRSGLSFPSAGDLPNLGIEPTSPASLLLAGRFFTAYPPGKPHFTLQIEVINCEREGKREWRLPRLLWNSLSAFPPWGGWELPVALLRLVQTKGLLRQFSASLLLLDSEKLWIKKCLQMRWEIYTYCFLLLLPNTFSIIIIFVSQRRKPSITKLQITEQVAKPRCDFRLTLGSAV